MAVPFASTPQAAPAVSELMKYIVSPDELCCAEYCFKMAINFSIKPKDNPVLNELKQILTGLLNTCGGMITITSADSRHVHRDTIDKWKLKLEDALVASFPFDVCRQCIRVLYHTHPLIILVTKTHKLITLNSNMYVRWIAGSRTFSDMENLHDVMNQVPEKCGFVHPFKDVSSVDYQTTLDLSEGPNLEFKIWKSVKRFHSKICDTDNYQARLKDARTQKTIFALPNMAEGGYLVIGVEENSTTKRNVILGQIINQDDELRMAQFFTEYLQHDEDGHPRVWGQSHCAPKPGIDWTIDFIPVTGGPPGERRRLIVVGFRHFQGGVFSQCPESYVVNEVGNIERMGLDEWLSRCKCKQHARALRVTSKYQGTTKPNSASQNVTAPKSVVISTPVEVVEKANTPTVISTGTTPDSSIDRTSGNTDATRNTEGGSGPISTGMRTDISTEQTPLNGDGSKSTEEWQKHRVFSWTKHSDNWEQFLEDSPHILEDNLHKFATQSRLFHFEIPMELTPDEGTIVATYSSHNIKEAIDHIRKSRTTNKSFGLAALHWLTMIHRETKFSPPRGHLLDVFSVDENLNIQMWSIAEEKATLKNIWRNLFLIGRITKRKLLSYQYNTDNQRHLASCYVDCRIYQLGSGETQYGTLPNPDVAGYFKSKDEFGADKFKICLARSLLLHETHVKDIFGIEHSVFLTEEQMEVILALGLDKFNYIEGAPGSGKTYLALHLCHKRNCAYICTTSTFQKFLQFQNVEHTFLVQSPNDMQTYLESQSFSGFDYLVVDDAHNVSLDKRGWVQLFDHIAAVPTCNLVIFADSVYQNYKRQQEDIQQHLQDFCMRRNFHLTVKTLSSIHRNSRKVTAFIKSSFQQDYEYPESMRISSTHIKEGDDVEVRHFSDVFINTSENSLVLFVRSLVDTERILNNESSVYEPKDIAVLLDTPNSTDDVDRLQLVFKKHMEPQADVHGADSFPVTGYTIDSVCNFMGLDRQICIVVISESVQQSEQKVGQSLANPRYRTFLASRGIYRVVFALQSNLTTSLASKFNLDKVPSNPQEVWHLERHHIVRDLCFININGQQAILYILGLVPRCHHLVTLDGTEITMHMDNPTFKSLGRVASCTAGNQFIVAGGKHWMEGPWKWSVYRTSPTSLQRIATYDLDAKPRSVRWSPDGGVIMNLRKPNGSLTIAKFSPSNGHLTWRLDAGFSNLWMPRRISISSGRGRVYVTDGDTSCVRELTSEGTHARDIHTVVRSPWGLCVDSRDTSMFVSTYESGRSKIFLVDVNGLLPRLVIEGRGDVRNMRLLDDKYLAVATDDGIVLYDVEGFI